MMSPDELNADLPESTYEEIEADGAYEEAMDAEQEEEENEIHFDDGTATDISDSVTIESYPEYSSDISSDSDLSGENPASFFHERRIERVNCIQFMVFLENLNKIS